MQELITRYRNLNNGEKIETLFLFQAGTVWASLESVYKCCKKNDRFSVKVALVTETTVETSHMAGAKNFLEREKIEYCLFEELDFRENFPHIVFIQFPYDAAFHTPSTLSLQFVRRGSRVIYVPYGIEISDTEIAIKDHFHSFVVENAWRIYTCCDGIKDEYEKYCHNRGAVRVCGSPKFDAIVHKDKYPFNRDIEKESYGRKVVVWKMHFPKKIKEGGEVYQITPYVCEYIEFAKRIKEYKELFFVVLMHPKMLRGVVVSDTHGDDSMMFQVKQLISFLNEIENCYIDTEDDYRNSFYHADAIIMDRSAVMIEAAMLNVPVLLMKNRDFSEKMTRPVENVVSTFYQGTGCMDMIDFLSKVISGEDEKEEERRKAVLDNFPFVDGKCGQRIVEDITNSINECHDKPYVILYGMGEICRYYMEKEQWGKDSRFKIIAVADSNESRWNTVYYGINVISPDMLWKYDFDAIVITTEPHYFEIKKALVYDYFLDERKIWRLDDFVIELDRMLE